MAGSVTTATIGGTAPAGRLPALREDLSLFEGPRNSFGAPSWTLYDPTRNRFFRIGWPEFEMIARWRPGRTASALAHEVSRQTTLSVDNDSVAALVDFLDRNSLLRISGTGQVRQLRIDQDAKRPSFATRLLRSHLFVRVPLFRPAAMLAFLQPVARLLYSKPFFALTLIAGIVGVFLAARQWDRFAETVISLFDWSSLLLIAGTVVIVKILHEFGHALTAYRFGCHVPSMGVAFMVLWPVLYTDTSDAWKLTSKRQRLAISGAGIGAELTIAAYATLAWSFLPEGPLQQAAFLIATTTWVLSVLVNLNPFMRFDGYFLFSDLLEVENLQERAFALARWRLREILFGFGDPPPEAWPRGKQTILLLYAYLTWAYRAALFVGIALLIYHFLFKLAGLLVFILEIVLLVGVPIARELREYFRRMRKLRMNRHIATTLILMALLIAAVATPWTTQVTVPSIIRPDTHTVVYAPATARIDSIDVERDVEVAAGTALASLWSGDLDNEIQIARAEVAVLERRKAFERFDPAERQNRRVVDSKLRAAQAHLAGLERKRAELAIKAPVGGTVVELSEDSKTGGWVAEGEPILVIADRGHSVIDAFIPERDVKRVKIGARVKFFPENIDETPLDGSVYAVDPAAANSLDTEYLASKFGGGIDMSESRSGRMVPTAAYYRARITLSAATDPLQRIARGSVTIEAARQSVAQRAWKSIVAVFVRESGF